MTSHEAAKKLARMAEFLLSKPRFEIGSALTIYRYFWAKESFLAAVKALGSGEKVYDSADLNFVPAGCPDLKISISRNKVCRKVQEEKWECEPLLSQEEEASIGAA